MYGFEEMIPRQAQDSRRCHFGYTAKMPRPIDAEEQVYWTLVCRFSVSSIQTFIAENGRRPNLVFERFLNIFLLFKIRQLPLLYFVW